MEYHRGLILGYDLVNLFINDLGKVSLESIVHSQSSWQLTSGWDDLVYLRQTSGWMRNRNLMKFSRVKCKFLHLGRKSSLQKYRLDTEYGKKLCKKGFGGPGKHNWGWASSTLVAEKDNSNLDYMSRKPKKLSESHGTRILLQGQDSCKTVLHTQQTQVCHSLMMYYIKHWMNLNASVSNDNKTRDRSKEKISQKQLEDYFEVDLQVLFALDARSRADGTQFKVFHILSIICLLKIFFNNIVMTVV